MLSMKLSKEPPEHLVKLNKKGVKVLILTIPFEHLPTREEVVEKMKALNKDIRKKADAA